jgi:hypothetical protein
MAIRSIEIENHGTEVVGHKASCSCGWCSNKPHRFEAESISGKVFAGGSAYSDFVRHQLGLNLEIRDGHEFICIDLVAEIKSPVIVRD